MENTVVARSSDDFWPQDPASHTTHVSVNAYNSLFMGAVVQPDWDMFHSRHPAALLHATARMVSPLLFKQQKCQCIQTPNLVVQLERNVRISMYLSVLQNRLVIAASQRAAEPYCDCCRECNSFLSSY